MPFKPAVFLLVLCCCAHGSLSAQSAKDATIAVRATVDAAAPAVMLSWPAPAVPDSLVVRRRLKGAALWTTLVNTPNSMQATLTDTNIQAGSIYEYAVQRTTPASGFTAYGYAMAAVDAASADHRGRVLLWIDSALLAPLAPEIDRLRDDLIGDGWEIVERHAGPSATVPAVKTQILADYADAPVQSPARAVFLLGAVPVPYSGNMAWDGHADHAGAWPADVYYGELTGNWTDATVNNTSPGRVANDNVPGDGKFDQSSIPTSVELAVGRVDFRRLNPVTFGVSDDIGLYRRYLDKDHAWRTGQYTVPDRALVDDNFGYFSGEAFAANGWRNAYPLVGDSNVVSGDFFGDSHPQRYLMAYGCGGGWYSGAGGVGSSDNFGTDTVGAVFTMLFGSYHGDWDFETNPFMPAALASAGGILTCSWAGRPHWFYHALAAGETVGFCAQQTQNTATGGVYPTASSTRGAHISLLGDPTVRAHVVAPPAAAQAEPVCGGAAISWAASTDPAILGYYVYRSGTYGGPYTRQTPAPVADLYFQENAPPGTWYYQVRAVRYTTSPGGGRYYNTSTGLIVPVVAVEPFDVVATGGQLPCNGAGVAISATTDVPGATYSWSGPGGWSANVQNPTVDQPGSYAVTATAPNGCTATSTATVTEMPPPLLNISLTQPSTASAADGAALAAVTGGTPPFVFQWSDGQSGAEAGGLAAGDYTVTATDSFGCTATATFTLGVSAAAEPSSPLASLTLAPNPAHRETALTVLTRQPGNYALVMIDPLGRTVWEKRARVDSVGSWTIDLRTMPAGSYTVRATHETGAVLVKILIVK